MSVVSFIVVFVCVWWLIFFMALPFGVQLDESGPEVSGPGAPKAPGLKKKALVTTLISIVICGMIVAAVQSNVFSFRDTAKSMSQEDYQ